MFFHLLFYYNFLVDMFLAVKLQKFRKIKLLQKRFELSSYILEALPNLSW